MGAIYDYRTHTFNLLAPPLAHSVFYMIDTIVLLFIKLTPLRMQLRALHPLQDLVSIVIFFCAK